MVKYRSFVSIELYLFCRPHHTPQVLDSCYIVLTCLIVLQNYRCKMFPFNCILKGEWLEVLGCGVIHTEVLDMAGRSDRRGWAFGLGLERLAMILFKIPDIRLFWTDDDRFTKQFSAGQITEFKSYSKYPPVYKDISFWIPDNYVENDFFEMARGIAGDMVEKIDMTDEFTNPKKQKTSKCYRITYRSMDRSLTDEEVNAMQDELRDRSISLGCEVR